MNKRTEASLKTILYFILPAIGILAMLFYIRNLGADVIYSDYIRIVAQYLPDVGNIEKLITPDILTRIPATFLARFINVGTFGYSVVFDRILSVAGLGIMAAVLARYAYLYDISFLWQVVIYLVLFSLIKWEVLLNGTAWAHLMSFGFFFVNYLLIDKLWRGETSPREEFLLFLFPVFLLLLAGEYIASYALGMTLLSIFGILFGGLSNWDTKRIQKTFRGVLICTLISLVLYVISRSFAVWEHSGATDMTFFEALSVDPLFLVVFFLKTFCGAFIGQETVADFLPGGIALNEYIVIALGVLVLSAYILAFYLYFRSELYEVSIFPIVLLVSGLINHFLVTFSRWIFLDSDYALSSRYATQYMVGIIGMLLIFAMYQKRNRILRHMPRKNSRRLRYAVTGLTVLLLAGNCYTTFQEITKERYRRENFDTMYEMVLNYRDYSADELKSMLEWTKDDETMYEAFGILEINKLNVFRR